jgi:hypothetical protein
MIRAGMKPPPPMAEKKANVGSSASVLVSTTGASTYRSSCPGLGGTKIGSDFARV